MPDPWSPSQYNKFEAERSQPFFDLLELVEPIERPVIADLGCGTGKLTAEMARRFEAADVIGIDSSEAMLASAAAMVGANVHFRLDDIATFAPGPIYDLIVANASLQWVPNHHDVLGRWRRGLRPGGQLAIQVPANLDHPSHVLAAEIAHEQPFLNAMGGRPPRDTVVNVLAPEAYAQLLFQLGFADQHVRLQVYPHLLDDPVDVVEWMRATSLTRFARVLPDELFEEFLTRFRQRVRETFGDRRPFFYPFKRILMWGRLPR